jgi:tetratricopeptide (TPR) repeat protein
VKQGVRRARIAAAAGLLALCGVCGTLAAQALPARARDSLSPQERELMDEYQDDHLITARRLAEELLVADENSMVGQYVLGNVLRRGEGALSEAMTHLGRARELYEVTWSVAPAPEGAPWQLHREIFYDIIELAQELERFDYRLEMIDYYDAIYEPDLHSERAWTMLKLGEFEAGREAANMAMRAGRPESRLSGLNALCALETEAGTRAGRLDACARALDAATELARAENVSVETPADGVNVAVHAYNAGLAALATFDAPRAEEFALQGTHRLTYTPANPWRLLTSIYVAQGRSSDAANALLEMDRWRQRQPPYLREQDRAQTQAVTAQMMLVAGETEVALRMISRAIDRPDRRGLTSASTDQSVGAYALTRLAIQRAHLERQREIAAAWDVSGRVPPHVALGNEWQRQSDIERVRAVMTRERLVATARPFSAGGLDLPIWLIAEWVDAVGPAVADAAGAAALEDEELGDAGRAYLMALDFFSSAERGDAASVARAAESALQQLPPTEVLLRAEIHARYGQSLSDRGANEEAAGQFAAAFDLDPSVIRRIGAALPSRVESDGGEFADEVARRLAQSPRLNMASAGPFVVRVRGTGVANAAVCLSGINGEELTCVRPEIDEDQDSSDTVEPSDMEVDYVRVVDAFHTQAFSMPIQLTTVSRSTLDGRTSASSAAARERVRTSLRTYLESSE